ncbi:hypothetical protein ES703_108899 [subsurface metagenome]
MLVLYFFQSFYHKSPSFSSFLGYIFLYYNIYYCGGSSTSKRRTAESIKTFSFLFGRKNHTLPKDSGTYRDTSPHSFTNNHYIWVYIIIICCPHLSSSSKSSLDLIEDEKHLIGITYFSDDFKVFPWRDNMTTYSHHRL